LLSCLHWKRMEWARKLSLCNFFLFSLFTSRVENSGKYFQTLSSDIQAPFLPAFLLFPRSLLIAPSCMLGCHRMFWVVQKELEQRKKSFFPIVLKLVIVSSRDIHFLSLSLSGFFFFSFFIFFSTDILMWTQYILPQKSPGCQKRSLLTDSLNMPFQRWFYCSLDYMGILVYSHKCLFFPGFLHSHNTTVYNNKVSQLVHNEKAKMSSAFNC
jgi:hypothetical protein